MKFNSWTLISLPIIVQTTSYTVCLTGSFVLVTFTKFHFLLLLLILVDVRKRAREWKRSVSSVNIKDNWNTFVGGTSAAHVSARQSRNWPLLTWWSYSTKNHKNICRIHLFGYIHFVLVNCKNRSKSILSKIEEQKKNKMDGGLDGVVV